MRGTAPVLVLLAAGLVLGPAAAPAAAQENPCAPVVNGEGDASGQPGGQLSDAVQAQEDAIGTELDDRRFEARLANATSPAERAGVVADELDRIERRLTATEDCWARLRAESASNETVDAAAPPTLDALAREARALHRHLNRTAEAAAALPGDVRTQRGVDAMAIAALERRVVALRTEVDRVRERRGLSAGAVAGP